jgi:hypothetical protein
MEAVELLMKENPAALGEMVRLAAPGPTSLKLAVGVMTEPMYRTGFAATSAAEKLMMGCALVTPVELRALAAAKASRREQLPVAGGLATF